MPANPPPPPAPVDPDDIKVLRKYLKKHGPTPFWDVAEALGFDENRLFRAEINLVRQGLIAEEPGANCAILKLTNE